MAVISRAGDFFYAFRFLRLLTTPFEKTKAFKFVEVKKVQTDLTLPEAIAEATKW